MINRSILLLLVSFTVAVIATSSAIANPYKLWTDVSIIKKVLPKSTQARLSAGLSLLPEQYRLLRLNKSVMQDSLRLVSNDSSIKEFSGKKVASKTSGAFPLASKQLELPLPNGKSIFLQVVRDDMLAPELAAKYPSIQTYKVKSNDNKGVYGSIDFTSLGFHAMLFMPDGKRLFIDPRQTTNEDFYISYYDKDYHPAEKKPLQCSLDGHLIKEGFPLDSSSNLRNPIDNIKTVKNG